MCRGLSELTGMSEQLLPELHVCHKLCELTSWLVQAPAFTYSSGAWRVDADKAHPFFSTTTEFIRSGREKEREANSSRAYPVGSIAT